MSRVVSAIAIGCSAGGVDALSAILPALQPDCDVPVFIVVHLPRERPSRLVDVFASRCRLSVSEAEDKQPVLAGNVYFAPPDYHLLLDAGPALSLSTDEPVHFCRPAIDVLFDSAADVFGSGLLGVVLSGANRDGAAGLSAVHAVGGATVVQRPETAAAGTMPAAALAAVPSSAVLELPRIADMLSAVHARRCPSTWFEPRTSA